MPAGSRPAELRPNICRPSPWAVVIALLVIAQSGALARTAVTEVQVDKTVANGMLEGKVLGGGPTQA